MNAITLTLLPLTALFLALCGLLILRAVRPASAYAWLVAVSGTLVSLVLLALTRSSWDTEIPLPLVGVGGTFPNGLLFSFDEISWGYSLALVTILLSSLLTGPAISSPDHRSRPAWKTLICALALTCLALIAVAAGNLQTLLIILGFLLLIEILTWLSLGEVGERSPALPAGRLFIRFAGLALLFLGTIEAIQGDPERRFAGFSGPAALLLILASGLQLGVLPPVRPSRQDESLPEILRPLLYISAGAPALLLLTRLAGGGSPLTSPGIWLVLACAALIGSAASFLAHPERRTATGWLAGAGAFVVAAALGQAQPAAMAWGLTCLLVGCSLLQYRNRNFLFFALALVMLLSLTSLPFTPTWAGAGLFSTPEILWLFFLFGQSMLVVAFFLSVRIKEPPAPGSDRVLRLIYLLGMAVLPLALVALALLPQVSNPELRVALLQLNTLLPGLVVLGFSLILIFTLRFWPVSATRVLASSGDFLSLNWLYKPLFRLTRLAAGLVALLNFLLEARAGMIWALLIVILLLTLVIQAQPGG